MKGEMKNNLHKALHDSAAFFAANRIDFAIIGGIAVMYRGEPRFTADINVVALLDVEKTLSLVDTLTGSPLEPLFPDIHDIVSQSFLLPLRHTKTTIPIDCALGMTGFEKQLVKRATPVEIGGTRLPGATAEDLLLLKLIAGRPRDTEDAYRIAARQSDTLDWIYLKKTGVDLQRALAQNLLPQIEKLQREFTKKPPS